MNTRNCHTGEDHIWGLKANLHPWGRRWSVGVKGVTVLSFAKTAALLGNAEPASIKDLRFSWVTVEGQRILRTIE